MFSLLSKLKDKLVSSSTFLYRKLLFKHDLSPQELNKIEDLLITCDFSYDMIDEIIQEIHSSNKNTEVIKIIQNYLEKKLSFCQDTFILKKKSSIIICGTNGSGKTTFIPKLTNFFSQQNFLIAPCDTFRAAAQEQLMHWKDHNTYFPLDLNKQPSALAFSSIEELNNNPLYNALIIDTAGRLSNNKNLMLELKKIYNISLQKSTNTQVLLVLDGSSGQNTITQIQEYSSYVKIDGVVITKLDTNAKGGAPIFFCAQNNIPIYFLSHGESKYDLSLFNAKAYAQGIIEIFLVNHD